MLLNFAFDAWFLSTNGSATVGKICKHTLMSIGLEIMLAGSLYNEYSNFAKGSVDCLGNKYSNFINEFGSEN